MHEDDLRWCANFALGTGFFVAFFGVVLAGNMAEGARCYVMVMAVGIGAAFALVGAWLHWCIREKIKRTTIRTREDMENDRLQALRSRSRERRGNDQGH